MERGALSSEKLYCLTFETLKVTYKTIKLQITNYSSITKENFRGHPIS